MQGEVQVPFGTLVPSLLGVSVFAILMVVAMVRFSQVALAVPSRRRDDAPPLAPGRRSPLALPGALYLASWAALIAAFLHLFAVLGDRHAARNLALMLLVAAGWLAFNGVLIAFGRAVERVAERQAAAAASPGEAEPDDAVDTVRTAPVPAAPAPGRRGGRLRAKLGQLACVAVVLAVVAGAEQVPALKALEALCAAHQRPLLAVTLALGAIGCVLFMGGTIHMVLTAGRPMSRREIERMERQSREQAAGAAVARRWVYRVPKAAVGAEAQDGATFAEIKAAWRARAWRVSPRWRRMFLMMLATALLAFGLFGSFIVIAPAGLKLILAGALVYAAVRTAWGFRQA
jgi:hypothetical protein